MRLLFALLLSIGVAPAFGQALPWDATYNAATRTTSVSVSSFPARNAANAGAFNFARAANDYRFTATGTVPGPLRAATVSATGLIGESALVRALSIATKGLGVASLGIAAWQLYSAFGAQSNDGVPSVWVNEGSMVFTYNGVQFVSLAAAVTAAAERLEDGDCDSSATSCNNLTVYIGRRFNFLNLEPASSPSPNFVVYVPVIKTINPQPYAFEDGDWLFNWNINPERDVNNPVSIAIGSVQKQTAVEADLMDLARSKAQPWPNLAPAVVDSPKPVPLAEPVPMKIDALPEPQVGEATYPQPGTSVTPIYTPRLNPDGQLVWDKTIRTQTPTGTTETPEPVTGTPTNPETVNPPPNPDFGAIPSLYTPVYPNGLQGVWDSRYIQLAQTPIFTFLGSLVPSFSSGGCPSWSFSPGEVLGINVSGEISVPCYVWSAVRLIMIISALMLCRRLIFGG